MLLKISGKRFDSKFLIFLQKLILKIGIAICSIFLDSQILLQMGLGFDANFKLEKENIALLGNFQSYKWFSPNTISALNSLKLKKEPAEMALYLEYAKTEKPICIHVRLGDYLAIPELNVVDGMYFIRAAMTLKNVSPSSKFWIFTNDKELATNMLPSFILENCRWIDEKFSAAETLELMRSCYCYVISNSTFSWWGAYLSYTTNPMVAAPVRWFNTLPDPIEICPSHWIRV
jgi:hypothetical protein